jgi:hypothetical protein
MAPRNRRAHTQLVNGRTVLAPSASMQDHVVPQVEEDGEQEGLDEGVANEEEARSDEVAVRVGCDASDLDCACRMVDDEQHVVGDQSALGPHVDREEVGGCDDISVGLQERPPRCRSIWTRGNPVGLERVCDGGARNVVPDFLQLATDAQVASASVVGCLENALVGVMFISAVPAYSLPHTAPRLTEQIPEASPLTKQGENLVISWDGVMVPLRGDEETIWKEAAVGRVSIYGKPREEDGKPPLLDSRYFARMPESGMSTLIDQVAKSVSDVRARRPFGHVAVVCDGKDSIWKTAEERAELDGAVLILDFYHASETLSGVADAVFGKGTGEARRWHERRRMRLQLDADAIDKLLRTLRRYETQIRAGSDERDVVRRAVRHFKKNRRRMCYDRARDGRPGQRRSSRAIRSSSSSPST